MRYNEKDNAFYWQRVDRNLGIITPEEQQRLRNCTVAIAGCGGMGGLISMICARIGVGRIRFSDNQLFDESNINRQYAAGISTVGKSKAQCTYQAIKEIVGDNVELECSAMGVNEENAEEFVDGVDFIFDEIELFQIAPRIHLHRAARKLGKKVLNCNVIGFGTRIFLFTPESMTMEDFLGMTPETELNEAAVRQLISRLGPRLPADITDAIIADWLIGQHKAPIFGGTPPISCGIVVDQFVLQFLGTTNRPWIRLVPPMPAYGYFDCGTFEAGISAGQWW
jgi:molybdopterin/thiamine biosynthesis adenylyltransferase